jgi:hypothetical protein
MTELICNKSLPKILEGKIAEDWANAFDLSKAGLATMVAAAWSLTPVLSKYAVLVTGVTVTLYLTPKLSFLRASAISARTY